jgi:ECF sigma factor
MNEALTQLDMLDPRQAKIVELRFFGGLELEEIAKELDVSVRTVKRDWHKARAFLYDALPQRCPLIARFSDLCQMPIFLTPGLWRRIGAVLDRLSDSNLDLQPRAVDEACQTEGIDTLTLQIGSSCSAIPDAEKTRVYEASIGQIANRKDLGDVVTLTGAHFLTGPICTLASGRFASIGCSQFFASEDLDWVGFFLQNNNDPSARRAYRRTDVVRRLARDHRPCRGCVQQRVVDRRKRHG